MAERGKSGVLGGSTPPIVQTGESTRSRRGITGAPDWINSLLNILPSGQLLTGVAQQGVLSPEPYGDFMSQTWAPARAAGRGIGTAAGFIEGKAEELDQTILGAVPQGLKDAFARLTGGQEGGQANAPDGLTRNEQGNLVPVDGGIYDGTEDDIFAKEGADPQRLFDRANRAMQLNQDLEALANNGDLDEQSQVLVNELRANLADEMDQLELDLQKQKQQLGVQDAIFNFQAKELLGLDLDLAPLEEAIKQEGGVGAQTMLAINSIANDAALSAEEKGDAVDAVLARGHFSDAIVESIDEMVRNRDDIQKLQEMSDVELLGDEARFFSPMFPNVTLADDFERYTANFTQRIYDSPLGEVVTNMDDPTFQLYQNVQNIVREKGARSEEATALISQLAQATGTDLETWRNELDAAKIRADNSEAAKEAAVDAKSLKPGSEAMVYAIIGAGQEMGIPDEMLTLLANSAELHAIIQVKSEGRAGGTYEGTLRGVGGLTEDMYHQLMGESWSPDKGMKYELQALLAYIMRAHQGDPLAALDFYRKTGEWGGVPSMEGGETLEQPDMGANASTAAGG